MNQARPWRKGISLMEVLVVTVIVALLASLVLAGVGIAKREGLRSSATSDGRQIYLAMSLYAEDAGKWHYGPLDEFVATGHLNDPRVLLAPTDKFARGYAGEMLNSASTFRYVVQHPVSWEGHFRGDRESNDLYFEKVAQFDDNPGILALRVLGDRHPEGGTSGHSLLFLFHGPLLRVRLDGSLQRATFPIFETRGGGNLARRTVCPAYLFTDERDPLLCKF